MSYLLRKAELEALAAHEAWILSTPGKLLPGTVGVQQRPLSASPGAIRMRRVGNAEASKQRHERYRQRILAARAAAQSGDVEALRAAVAVLTKTQQVQVRLWAVRKGLRWLP